ncbi:ATP-binding protein [Umezawaea tangerina]|uniref:AAA ATPase-like protein n=1 Tax=Umezawaea tangerina TaxID=84725 RepID=A0A2T0SWP2_9PSEU|nr:ATP-binding protein [Umezawaea tangerina]PRY37832.1 hypothetical protein CLV43_10952 [Umezawaea tangerina]
MTGAEVPTSDQPAVNPFLLPASGGAPLRPLCPWDEPSDADYYVDINHTGEAFTQFQEQMGELASLRGDGRFVLVTGESTCGKTSLINRCAAWLRDRLGVALLRTLIVDLTREGATAAQSVHERMTVICRRLLDELGQERVPDASVITELAERCERPDLFYPYLANNIPDDVRLVILLPPTDELIEELVRYATLARRKMVIFAESAYLNQGQVNDLVAGRGNRDSTIVLGVGQLREGDVRRFVRDRLERHSDSGEYPWMDDETIEKVAVPLRSIGTVQRILYEVYEDRRRSGLTYSRGDVVTYQDITEFVYEKHQRRLGVSR